MLAIIAVATQSAANTDEVMANAPGVQGPRRLGPAIELGV